MSNELKKLTETVNSSALDINRLEAILKEVSLIVRDLGGKMDLLLDARAPEVAQQSQASPSRKPIGRGKVTKPRRKTEPEEDIDPTEELSEESKAPVDKTPVNKAPVNKAPVNKAPIDEPKQKKLTDEDKSQDDSLTVKKPAAKAKPKTSKPIAFNKLTAFTQAYRANPKRFNEYFTKEVRDAVDAAPEVAGLTGDKLESARIKALYQTTVVNYPEIIDELRADFAKAQESEDI